MPGFLLMNRLVPVCSLWDPLFLSLSHQYMYIYLKLFNGRTVFVVTLDLTVQVSFQLLNFSKCISLLTLFFSVYVFETQLQKSMLCLESKAAVEASAIWWWQAELNHICFDVKLCFYHESFYFRWNEGLLNEALMRLKKKFTPSTNIYCIPAMCQALKHHHSLSSWSVMF